MASQLANLLASTVATVAKAPKVTQAVPTRSDKDQFARLVDSQPAETKTPAAPTAKEASPAVAANDDAVRPDEVALSTPDDTESQGEDQGATQSLADSLLAALALLGLNTEAKPVQTGAALDGAALSDIEGALGELSELLGMDLATLMQQLADLAKGAGEAVGDTDLAERLGAWLGQQPGGSNFDAKAEAALTKLVAGLEAFAKAIPTEPTLGMAELDLPEPVLAKPASSAEAEVKVIDKSEPEAEPKAEAGRATEAAPTQQNKNQPNAANKANEADHQLNLTQVAQKAEPAAQQLETAAPRVIQAGYQTSQQQLNLPQIAFELSRQVQDGNTRFQIRLDPPELGRIDVKLEIDNTGRVTARLTVEKAETLDLMQRDQRALERALQQAGLDQNKTNLEFSLKQNPFAGQQNQGSEGEHAGMGGGQDGPEETEVPAPAITLYRGSLQASGLNIIA